MTKPVRIYLDVPYTLRHYVARLGAQWDGRHGHWWVRATCKDYRLNKYITFEAQIPKNNPKPNPHRLTRRAGTTQADHQALVTK